MIKITKRVPEKIDLSDLDTSRLIKPYAIGLKHSGRLLTLREIKYVRRYQLEYTLRFESKKKFVGILEPGKHPIRWPVFCGKNQETIVIYKKDDKDLGYGTFARVFLGLNEDTGEYCAVKVQKHKDKFHMKHEKLFAQENKALNDNNILIDSLEYTVKKDPDSQKKYVNSEDEKYYYTVMKLAWGKELFNLIFKENKKFNPFEKVDIVLETLKEVKKLHDNGYLHLDLKIENLIWDELDKKISIVDFGFSVKMDENGKFETTNFFGTPDCLPPESWKNGQERIYTAKSDIYSLGVAFCALLSCNRIGVYGNKQFRFFMNKSDEDRSLITYSKFLVAPFKDIFRDQQNNYILSELNSHIKTMVYLDPKKRSSLEDLIEKVSALKKKISSKPVIFKFNQNNSSTSSSSKTELNENFARNLRIS